MHQRKILLRNLKEENVVVATEMKWFFNTHHASHFYLPKQKDLNSINFDCKPVSNTCHYYHHVGKVSVCLLTIKFAQYKLHKLRLDYFLGIK